MHIRPMSASASAATGRSTVDWATLVSFTVGRDLLAVPVELVERVLRATTLSVLPQLPPYVDGVITYGGRMVTVVDLRRRLGRTVDQPTPNERIVVFAVGREWRAVLVDSVRDVIRIDATSIVAPPSALRGLPGEYLLGVAERNGRELLILDIGRLLSSTESVQLEEEHMESGSQQQAQPDART